MDEDFERTISPTDSLIDNELPSPREDRISSRCSRTSSVETQNCEIIFHQICYTVDVSRGCCKSVPKTILKSCRYHWTFILNIRDRPSLEIIVRHCLRKRVFWAWFSNGLKSCSKYTNPHMTSDGYIKACCLRNSPHFYTIWNELKVKWGEFLKQSLVEFPISELAKSHFHYIYSRSKLTSLFWIIPCFLHFRARKHTLNTNTNTLDTFP